MIDWEALVGGCFPFVGSIGFVVVGNKLTDERAAALRRELDSKIAAIQPGQGIPHGFEPERIQFAAKQVSDLAQVFPSVLLTAFGAGLITVLADSAWLRLVTVVYLLIAIMAAIFLWSKYSTADPYAYHSSGAFGLSPPAMTIILVNIVGLILMVVSQF